jgi:hypothetical protein
MSQVGGLDPSGFRFLSLACGLGLSLPKLA